MEEEPIEMLLHQTQHIYMKYAMSKVKAGTEKLHGGQAGILFILNFEGGMSQKELANMLHLSAPSVTSAIQKLELENCIVRKQDEKDQRVMRISITKKGEEFVNRVIDAGKAAETQAMKGISKEEEMQFRRILTKMRDNLIEGKDVENGKAF